MPLKTRKNNVQFQLHRVLTVKHTESISKAIMTFMATKEDNPYVGRYPTNQAHTWWVGAAWVWPSERAATAENTTLLHWTKITDG